MNVPTIGLSAPVGQIARHYPATIAVLEEMDVEFASHGGRPVREAAAAAGVDPDELLRGLQAAVPDAAATPEAPLAVLLETIIVEHHRLEPQSFIALTDRLPLDSPIAEIPRLRRLLETVHAHAGPHMLREERELFPRIEELDLHPHRVGAGSISQPLLIEFVEHDTIHEWMAKARELAFRLRDRDADPSIADSVVELHRGLHRHLHLENNVLIPRVVELENRHKATRRAAVSQ